MILTSSNVYHYMIFSLSNVDFLVVRGWFLDGDVTLVTVIPVEFDVLKCVRFLPTLDDARVQFKF